MYSKIWLEANEVFLKEDYDKATKMAKNNLSDPSLPRYHRVKKLMLLATAENRWYHAEKWRRMAESILYNANLLTRDDEVDVSRERR